MMNLLARQWFFNVWFLCVSVAALAAFTLMKPVDAAPASLNTDVQRAIQAAVDHHNACFARRDLMGLMALYTPDYQRASVAGRSENYLQTQAHYASSISRTDFQAAYQCTVSHVMVQNGNAQAILHWRYTYRFPRASSNHYTFLSDYQDLTRWRRGRTGWQEARDQIVRDAEVYQSTRPTPLVPRSAIADPQAQRQIQAAVNQAASGYAQRNVAQMLAMYAPTFAGTNASGEKSDIRSLAAFLKSDFSLPNFHLQGRCVVSSVVVNHGLAFAALHWHFTDQHTRTAKTGAYVSLRYYVDHSVWTQSQGRWRQVRAQLSRDTELYEHTSQ